LIRLRKRRWWSISMHGGDNTCIKIFERKTWRKKAVLKTWV
jgi:hypothetical protein